LDLTSSHSSMLQTLPQVPGSAWNPRAPGVEYLFDYIQPWHPNAVRARAAAAAAAAAAIWSLPLQLGLLPPPEEPCWGAWPPMLLLVHTFSPLLITLIPLCTTRRVRWVTLLMPRLPHSHPNCRCPPSRRCTQGR